MSDDVTQDVTSVWIRRRGKTCIMCEPAHEILVLTGFGQNSKPPFNTRADISSRARGVKFGLSLHLHPYYVYGGSKD